MDNSTLLIIAALALAISLAIIYAIVKSAVTSANKELLRQHRILVQMKAQEMKKNGMGAEVDNAIRSVNEYENVLKNSSNMSQADFDKKQAEYFQ